MAGGAEVAIIGRPGSNQDNTADDLVDKMGVKVFSWRNENYEEHMKNERRVLEAHSTIISDNGGDLHFGVMPESVILCNASPNQLEIDIDNLYDEAERVRGIHPNVEELILPSGKKFFLLARGNSVNILGGDGNSIEIMDLGISLQTLNIKFCATRADELIPGPQTVPQDIENATVKAAISEWVGYKGLIDTIIVIPNPSLMNC